MTISISLQNQGEQVLYVQPMDADVKDGNLSPEEVRRFMLIQSMQDVNNPIMIFSVDLKSQKLTPESSRDIDEENDVLSDKLDSLAQELLEAIRQGVDLSAENIPDSNDNTKPYNPELIRVDSTQLSLRHVYDMLKDGDINMSPDFQRNLVWDQQRKSRLIESILLRIPLPVFYFSADEKGQLAVVDGLQRLTAIKEFMDNDLPLKGLEYLSLAGCTYTGKKKLDERLYRRFNLTQIVANVIDSSSPARVKYDIFRRLNTGGRPLNAQELRNCLASNRLRLTLRTMSRCEEFLAATTKSVSDKRMDAQELALRFLYFRYLFVSYGNIEAYSGSMDDDLDKSVDMFSSDNLINHDEYIESFKRAMTNAKHLFDRFAFRKVLPNYQQEGRSVINKALFVCWAILLADYDTEWVATHFKKEGMTSIMASKLHEDLDLLRMLSFGTNGWKNLTYSFNQIRGIVDELMA